MQSSLRCLPRKAENRMRRNRRTHGADPKALLRTAHPTIWLASRTYLFDLVFHRDRPDPLAPAQRKSEQPDEAGRIGGVIAPHVEGRQVFRVKRMRRLP